MVFTLYIKELKYRLIYILIGTILCFSVTYSYSVECFYILSKPFCEVWGSGSFLLINIFEVLFGYLKLAVVISLIYFFGLSGLHLLLFLLGGIYWEKMINLLKPLCGLLFQIFCGIYIIYNYILGLLYNFIIKLSKVSVGKESMFDIEPRMMNYIELNIKLAVLMVLVLLLPNIVYMLSEYLFKDWMLFLRYRSWFYLLLLLLILSVLPPDILLHLVTFMLMVSILELIVVGMVVFKSYSVNLKK